MKNELSLVPGDVACANEYNSGHRSLAVVLADAREVRESDNSEIMMVLRPEGNVWRMASAAFIAVWKM